LKISKDNYLFSYTNNSCFFINTNNRNEKNLTLFDIFWLLMPLSFIFISNRKWDKWIGDLSYPIYINHMLAIYVSTFIVSKIVPNENIIFISNTVSLHKIAV
jgi:hypothetical protein